MTPSLCGGNELCEAAVVAHASRLWGQRASCPLTRDVVTVEGEFCEPAGGVIGVAEFRPPRILRSRLCYFPESHALKNESINIGSSSL